MATARTTIAGVSIARHFINAVVLASAQNKGPLDWSNRSVYPEIA